MNVLKRLHRRFKIISNDSNWLNMSIHGMYHDCTGTIAVKNNSGEYFRVDRNDKRFLSGELVGVNKNIKNTKNAKIMKGTVWAENILTKERCRLLITDIRYTSGAYVSVGTGANIFWTDEMKNKRSEQSSGVNNPMYGKSAVKGRKWFNDGCNEFFIFPDDNHSKFQAGRLKVKKSMNGRFTK